MLVNLPMSKLNHVNLVTLTLPPNYGYCVLIALGSAAVVRYKAARLEVARKRYNISYPDMYKDTFNPFSSIQLSHQKTLEYYPQFLSLLLLGGLDSPVWCACGGLLYVLGKIVFPEEYYNENPKNKIAGIFGEVGLIVMGIATGTFALKLLRYI